MENYQQGQFESIELHTQDIERYIPNFHLTDDSDIKALAHLYLNDCHSNLRRLHKSDYNSEHIVGIQTLMMDRLVVELFNYYEKLAIKKLQHQGERAILVAQGGYGRGEMNIFSDLDLLFIYPKKRDPYIEHLTEGILYIVWDLKLEVGYATRTIKECKQLMLEDVTIMTSLLDCRYLAGNDENFSALIQGIKEVLQTSKVRKKLVEAKILERKNRIEKFGNSVFVLEPNVKECAGGLRDLQSPLWIAKIMGIGESYEDLYTKKYLSKEELKSLMLARNFLWRLRNALHFLAKRKNDVLTFDRQEKIALAMGFEHESNGILGVEKFMQFYYKLAYDTLTIVDGLIRRMHNDGSIFHTFMDKFKAKSIDDEFYILDGHLHHRTKDIFNRQPAKMMVLFEQVQATGLPLSVQTKDELRMASGQIDDNYIHNPEMIKIFRRIMNKYENFGLTMMAMHEVHFLDEWMPEFKKLRCRVQHDMYHIYTIDTHSIFAVNELSKLYSGSYDEKFDDFKEVLLEIDHPELLNLGLLLHDIGKGEGGGHSEKGAVIAKSITERLGYTQEEKDIIDFLIISHLMMPHLSQRRDIEDEDLIYKFAQSCDNLQNLNMLLLLTWGDIRAVGPNAWTDWKGGLLYRLYEKTRNVIKKGSKSTKSETKTMLEDIKSQLRAMTNYSNEIAQRFEIYIGIMPPRYFFAVEKKQIIKHFELLIEREKKDFFFDTRFLKEQNVHEMIVFTVNNPTVFPWVTGVFRAYKINILSVEVFQTTDGRILMLMKVGLNENDGDINRLTNNLERDLERVLMGELKIANLIQKNKLPEYLEKKPIQKAKNKVVIDNDVSAYYTVIDVYAHDRLGLLYDMTKVLSESGCFVDLAKISTKVEQVIDVFYVKDVFGHKINSRARLKKLEEDLMKVISYHAPEENTPQTLESDII